MLLFSFGKVNYFILNMQVLNGGVDVGMLFRLANLSQGKLLFGNDRSYHH